MSNLVRFEKVDNELNILRIGGKSFLPPDVEGLLILMEKKWFLFLIYLQIF